VTKTEQQNLMVFALLGAALYIYMKQQAAGTATVPGIFTSLTNAAGSALTTVENALNISPSGVAFIEQFESFSATVYNDVGHQAIGYGHDLVAGDGFDASSVITQQDASALLAQDVQSCINTISGNVTVPLTQNQIDALCDFIYNCGAGAFMKSICGYLNASDFVSATNVILQYHNMTVNGALTYSQGLQDRRNAEVALFNT
jgi:lysozyme